MIFKPYLGMNPFCILGLGGRESVDVLINILGVDIDSRKGKDIGEYGVYDGLYVYGDDYGPYAIGFKASEYLLDSTILEAREKFYKFITEKYKIECNKEAIDLHYGNCGTNCGL